MRACVREDDWRSHQIPVEVLVGLQVGHALGHVLAHLKQLDVGGVLLQALLQVGEQAAIGEELCHDVDGPLLGAHAVELHQVLMAELPGRLACDNNNNSNSISVSE